MSRMEIERAALAFFRSIRRTRLPIYEPYDCSLYLTYENLRTTFVHKSYKVVYRFSPVNPFELNSPQENCTEPGPRPILTPIHQRVWSARNETAKNQKCILALAHADNLNWLLVRLFGDNRSSDCGRPGEGSNAGDGPA